MSAESTAEPLHFPAISPSELQLSRLLNSRQTDFYFLVADRECHITLDNNRHQSPPEFIINLRMNDQPVQWFIHHGMLDQLLPKPLNHKSVSKLPKDLSQAALIHSFSPVFMAAQQASGLSLEFISLEPVRASDQPMELSLCLTIDETHHETLLTATPNLLEVFSRLPAHIYEQAPDISIWANLFLGRSILSRLEVSELAIGDVVFLQQHVTGQQLAVRINRHTAFVGEADGTTITLRQRMDLMEEQESQTAPEANDEANKSTHENTGIDLSELSVELLFEIGCQQFSAQEIQGMQPGYVFDLDRPIEQPVQIRANGKLIAQCELVQIDNRLGARITTLND